MYKRFRHAALLGVLLVAASGCAGTPPPDRTRFIGEVAHVPTRDEILSGNIPLTVDNRGREPLKMSWIRKSLLDEGMKDEELVYGRVALTRHQYYWHNTGSGIVRQFFRSVTVPKELTVEVGNVIEIETFKGIGRASKVRYKARSDGNCTYRNSDSSVFHNVMGALTLVGPSGAASLYCPDLEKEGWKPHKYGYGIDWQMAPTP